MLKKGNISLYYIGYDRKRNVFDKGAGRETRHTTGSRIWGTYKSFDYNYEILFQTGHFRGGPILALGVATDTGITKAKWRFSPRFSLRSDTASGDRDHNGTTLGTFNPMFPSTAYSGKIGLIGAANVFDLTPNVRLRLHKRLYFLPEASTFFRESTADGIYSVISSLQKTGQKSQARYIGSQASAPFQFNVNRHVTYTAVLTRFWAGQFLKETPPGRSVTYFTTFVTYKF
jgi:hypothetical protein